MGESMVTVARSSRMADRMCEFLNAHGQMLGAAAGMDYAPSWWVYGERRIQNKFTGFWGMGRCMDFAAFRWAALKVGRMQKSFPLDGGTGRIEFSQAVPYVRYGDFESWPVIGPDQRRAIVGAVREKTGKPIKEQTNWMMVDAFGCNLDAKNAYLYLRNVDKDWVERMAQAQKEVGITPPKGDWTDEDRELHWKATELVDVIARPWCEEQLKPLLTAMKKLDKEWG